MQKRKGVEATTDELALGPRECECHAPAALSPARRGRWRQTSTRKVLARASHPTSLLGCQNIAQSSRTRGRRARSSPGTSSAPARTPPDRCRGTEPPRRSWPLSVADRGRRCAHSGTDSNVERTKRNTRFLVLCFICAPTVASSVHRVHLELWLRRLESAAISEARRASGNEWEEVAMRASLWFPLVVLMTPYLDPFLMSIPVVRQPHSTRSSSRDAPGAFVPIACADRKTLSPSRPRRRNRRPG